MNMRITSRSAASRVAQSESVSQPGSVPVRVRSAAAARNGNGPAKRSFRGVCPRVSTRVNKLAVENAKAAKKGERI